MSQVSYVKKCFAHFNNSLKWYISIIEEKWDFLVLHKFISFSGCRVNQIVNKYLNG